MTKRIYPEMRHETLNEIGREEAMAEFAAWAEGSLPSPGAVAGMMS